MNSLWKNKFTKASKDGQPKKILEDQGNELSSITSGKVYGVVEPFSSSIVYEQLGTIAENLKLAGPNQSYLGERGNARTSYEFYITSEATPKYMFRVLLLSYDISVFPLDLIVEKSICDELDYKTDRITCENEERYIEVLGSILNSVVVTEIVNKLLSLN